MGSGQLRRPPQLVTGGDADETPESRGNEAQLFPLSAFCFLLSAFCFLNWRFILPSAFETSGSTGGGLKVERGRGGPGRARLFVSLFGEA